MLNKKIITIILCILIIGTNIEIIRAISKQEENRMESMNYPVWGDEGFIIGKIKDMEIVRDDLINYTAVIVLFMGWWYFEHTPRRFTIDLQHRFSISVFEVDNFKGVVTDNFICGFGDVSSYNRIGI